MMVSAPPRRSPVSTVGIEAGMITRVICCGRRRAHAARGEQQLRVDGADAGRGREHHREEAVDAREDDLRFRADAEPGGEDRIEDHDRHRVQAGEHRQQQAAQQRDPADQRAGQDAEAAGDQHRERDFVERDAQFGGVFAPVLHQHRDGLRQRRQEQLGNDAGARHQLPEHEQRDEDQPADGGGGGAAHSPLPCRICCQMRSRSRPNTSVAIIS